MARQILWAAAIALAGSMIMAVGCRTAPERTASAGPDTMAEPRTAPEGTASAGSDTMAEPRTTEERRTGTPPRAEAGATTAGAAPFEVTGRVESVDESRIEIAGRTLAIDSSTSIMKGGVGASLENIKEGDEVRATLSGSGDPPKAERIEVMSPTTDATSPPEQQR